MPKKNEFLAKHLCSSNNIKKELFKHFEETSSEKPIGDLVEITYSQLKTLRDAGKLIPGTQYRITDYHCTTTQENTHSADHQFDIIVTADDEKTLNENARACLHEGDTYFSEAGANLAAWELKYSLDNNTERFTWADASDGKGVIYYMKDEWNNECPYDFKNIQFKRKISLENGYPEYAPEDGTETLVYTFTATSQNVTTEEWSGLKDGSLESPYGHESDENTSTFWGNHIGEYRKLYDFEDEDNTKCGKLYLNDIVFLGYWEEVGSGNPEDYPYYYSYCCYSNTFGNDCYSNTFGNNCFRNTFGNNCYSNTFGNNCSSNTFGNNCFRNTFGNDCYSNTFGNNCSSNTFGNDCDSNTFGNDCDFNTFGNDCDSNTFGDNCDFNTFGDNCSSNIFGNNCFRNTFGNNCSSNTFGNDCYSNTFGNNCSSNTFGNNCYSNTFGNDCHSNTFGNNCYSNTFGNSSPIDYCRHIALGDGVQYCKIYGSTTPTISKYLQNIKVAQGLQGTNSSNLSIEVPTNLAYDVYVGKNSSGVLKKWCPADNISVELEEDL